MCVHACVSACVRVHACVSACVLIWITPPSVYFCNDGSFVISVYTAKREKEEDEDRKTRMTLRALRHPKKRAMHVPCSYCVRTFPSPQARDGHFQSHAESRPDRNKYTCDVCDITFPRFLAMQQHRLTNKGINKNRCSRCGYESRDATALSKHWKSCQ